MIKYKIVDTLYKILSSIFGKHRIQKAYYGSLLPLADFFGIEVYLRKAYSLEGEDLLLWSLIERYVFVFKMLDKKILHNGFYVDVGAYHPKRFSNTYKLYKEGWSGINIDCMPGSMAVFNKKRARDINLEIAISDHTSDDSKYYIFDDPGANPSPRNGFLQKSEVEWLINEQGIKIREIKNIRTSKLAEILDLYLKPGQEIDLLNIDAEGNDINILKSNDWAKYRPKFIMIEADKYGLRDLNSSDLSRFLETYSYTAMSKMALTILYVRNDIFPK
jgi:hypothetical protein